MMRSRRPWRFSGAAVVLAALLAACGSAPGTTDPEGVDSLQIPTPSPDPTDFVATVDNPLLPLLPGSTWTYEGSGDGGAATVTVTVLDSDRDVAGVAATVVRTEVEGPGAVETTDDWYAQDRAGNVWHLGADGDAGSWEAGLDGAQAGVAMLARPRLGDGYREELADGVAEDVVEVLAIDAEVDLAVESYDDVVQTEVTSPLQPGLVERRYYAAGVGLVATETETTTGVDGRLILVALRPG